MSQTALRKRIMPAVPLVLEIENGDGSKLSYGWKVTINYNVLADAQEQCGYNFLGGVLDWVDDPNRLRALLWASLLPHQPELKDEMLTIGEYLDGGNRLPVLESLFKAFSLYLHKDKRPKFDEATSAILKFVKTGELPKEAEEPGPLAETMPTSESRNSDGKSSGPSPDTTSESLTTKSSAA